MNIITIIKSAFLGEKTPLISSIIAGFVSGIILLISLAPQTISAEFLNNSLSSLDPVVLVKNGKLTVCKIDKSSYEIVKKIKMVITAYSSTEDQTDDTPFITASGRAVAAGIKANNMLPFGTKIKIPELFGDKIFVVEDRMNQRKGKYHADIWFEDYSDARDFGAKVTEIVVIES
jgi:3D (Asp-Asp-Asp) domain-containing protein